MTYERADAIIIRSIDFSETSRIFTFYTREYGRLSALAKGAKRKYSRLIGHVDLLSHSEIIFTSTLNRERLHLLTEANASESFLNIRRELPRFYAACHAIELVYSMTAAEDPSRELFDRLLDLLRRLDAGLEPALALFAFEAHLLVLTGFMPELGSCVSCGKRNREKTAAFSPTRGGILCRDCAPGESGLVRGVPAGALGLLDRLAHGKLTRLERVRVSGEAVRQVRTFLHQYETHVIGWEPRTAKHL